MSNPKPIQFLLHQLANSDVKFFQNIVIETHPSGEPLFRLNKQDYWFEELEEIYQEKIIRICLSRVNNQPVLSIFGGILGTKLYEEFDRELFVGKPFDTALQALHDKMMELVPEYKHWVNQT